MMQDWQGERRGFACARLGASHHIPFRQDGRDRF